MGCEMFEQFPYLSTNANELYAYVTYTHKYIYNASMTAYAHIPDSTHTHTYIHIRMHTLCTHYTMCIYCIHSGALAADLGSSYGAGTLPFLIGYLYCLGSEGELANCFGVTDFSYIPDDYCNANTVAGVQCLGKC